jgi:hypothetical protein
VDAYLAQYADARDERGHRLVVHNESHQPREVLTSAGAVEANDKRPDPATGKRMLICCGTANAAGCARR